MQNEIRILHMISSLNIGGSQAFVMNLYRNIDRNLIQFDFIIDHPNELYFKEEIEELGGRVYSLPGFNGFNIGEVKKAWNRFFREHPDYRILHSHTRSYASLYLPIAKKNGLKTIIHSHSTSNGTGAKALIKKVLQYPLRYQADYLFACSEISGEWLYGKRAIKKENYKMIPNAIDVGKYTFSNKNRSEIRKEFNIPNGDIVLGHVGRFHEAKNHLFLLDVFYMYNKRHSNAKLLLVGDGELRKVIENRINELGLCRSVIMTGAKNDVNRLLSAMDYFLFPSIWEGLPVAVVEAQAAGLPCFVSSTVTKDVAVSSLVKYLTIKDGVECWVDEIENTPLTKTDVSSQISEAGFDMKETSKELSNFYKELFYA